MKMLGKDTKWIDLNKEKFVEISDKIWSYAETGLEEFKSSDLLVKTLEQADFEVKKGVADMPTSLVATYGSNSPTIAILGEYDALPGLSQVAEPIKKPINKGAPGHGCGHNLLGTGSLAAVMAVKEAIEAG
ncbi:MAG: amidohydrolase, partial [Promethearchaeota archaeon]